jgi:hypothetical protein
MGRRAVLAVLMLLAVLVEGAAAMQHASEPAPYVLVALQHCTHMCIADGSVLDTSTITDLR